DPAGLARARPSPRHPTTPRGHHRPCPVRRGLAPAVLRRRGDRARVHVPAPRPARRAPALVGPTRLLTRPTPIRAPDGAGAPRADARGVAGSVRTRTARKERNLLVDSITVTRSNADAALGDLE